MEGGEEEVAGQGWAHTRRISLAQRRKGGTEMKRQPGGLRSVEMDE